ncbi:MAG: hypothetical protein HY318_06140 [Armatimonadetes bacterium]|nr:hypothetical protein [Armatimonadota bacterium]
MTKSVLLVSELLLLICFAAATAGANWEDTFDRYNQETWTTQPSGLRLAEEPLPAGVAVKSGVLVLDETLRGVRLTSRQKFLFGTFEARVRIRPRGYQYIGFMSRAPWGANCLMGMSLPERSGWRLVHACEGKGGGSSDEFVVPDNAWCDLKIVWEKDKAQIFINGDLKGQAAETSRIPQSPIPIILDALANNPMEIDWIKVTGDQSPFAGKGFLPPLAVRANGPDVFLQSKDWKIAVNRATGQIRQCLALRPTPAVWTPHNARGLDLYVRQLPEGAPVRFVGASAGSLRKEGNQATSFECVVRAETEAFRDALDARLRMKLNGAQLDITARFTARHGIDGPVEIGLGLPFRPEAWRRQVYPRLPWLALSPRQEGQIRLPFLADPDDATVASATGNWIFYPFGLLEGNDRIILWGSMDVGRRLVMSPNNYGSVPAVTLAPKRWPKGKTLELALTMRAFAKPESDLPGVLRWYLSHCHSSDPLTSDLFPVRDWTPRVFAKGGGVGMPDVRITRVNPASKIEFSDRVEKLLKDYSVPNLWLGSWHCIDGSYPVSGTWTTVTGLSLSAEAWKAEVARLKEAGLRPCLYAFQFIVPELCKEGGKPDKSWVAHGADGNLSLFDRYVAGEGRGLGDWFTKELAEKIGSNVVTWAFGDYGNDDFRRWYTEQTKATIDYYQPSGISFDWGWAVMGPDNVYSPANPRTSQAHGRLRVQADIWKWLRANHPEMQVIVNDIPGSPSQFFANCMLLESSDVMSDLDFLAGKALGSAMSSMDYFADHDRGRWTRQIMLDLARGCSFGAPFWILTSPPEADYIATWRKFLEFSGRTTRLPLLSAESAVTTAPHRDETVGSVWSDGREVMAAAFDRRTEGTIRQVSFHITIPKTIPKSANWQVARLSNANTEVSFAGWLAKRTREDRLTLSGPLGPGEMVLVEARR